MSKNAEDETGAESLSKALDAHTISKREDMVTLLQNVDTDDGEKIIKHILGSNDENVQKTMAKEFKLDAGQITKILATVAPILLSFLSYQKEKTKTPTNEVPSMISSLLDSLTENDEVTSLIPQILGSMIKK